MSNTTKSLLILVAILFFGSSLFWGLVVWIEWKHTNKISVDPLRDTSYLTHSETEPAVSFDELTAAPEGTFVIFKPDENGNVNPHGIGLVMSSTKSLGNSGRTGRTSVEERQPEVKIDLFSVGYRYYQLVTLNSQNDLEGVFSGASAIIHLVKPGDSEYSQYWCKHVVKTSHLKTCVVPGQQVSQHEDTFPGETK